MILRFFNFSISIGQMQRNFPLFEFVTCSEVECEMEFPVMSWGLKLPDLDPATSSNVLTLVAALDAQSI